MSASNIDPFAPRASASADPAKDLRDDLDALRGDIANLASSVSKLATDTMGAAAGNAQAMAKEKLSDFESAVRQNPTQSALIAVGVGFLVGLLLTR